MHWTRVGQSGSSWEHVTVTNWEPACKEVPTLAVTEQWNRKHTINFINHVLWAWFSCLRKLADKIGEPWNMADIFVCYFILQGGPKKRTCLSVDNSVMVTCRKACDMPKVLECCRQKWPNLHGKSFKYSVPNLHKSLSPLKLGICLHSHWTQKLTAKNPDFSVNYSVWRHCNRQNFSNWPAKTCADRMLGSADPEHIDSSNRSAA